MTMVIIKTFEIQSCVCGLHFFQDSCQPRLGEILNVSNEDDCSSLVHGRYAVACKDENGKAIGHAPKDVLNPMYFFINTVNVWK